MSASTPADTQRWLAEAMAAFQAGDLARAAGRCDEVLAIAPDRPDALTLRGMLHRRERRFAEAEACQRRAIAVLPDYFDAHNNLGNLLRDQFRFAEAADIYRAALKLRPGAAETWLSLAEALREGRQPGEALAAAEKALELAPSAAAWSNRGNALLDLDQGEAAVACYRRAVELDPGFADGWYNLGNASRDLCHLDEAIAAYRRALALKPDFARAHSNLLFTLQAHPAQTRRGLLEEHRQWERSHGEPRRRHWRPHGNRPDPARPLRIGYVSSDLGRHPVGYFLARVFESHDRKNFRIHCYSGRRASDDMTARLRGHADAWVDTVGMSDEELAGRIRADGIDILVDLAGHTAGNRLTLFALKPAPVQATWAGYVGTTGLAAMDWLVSDPCETPPGEDDDYVERIARLPDDYVCYEAPDYAPEVKPPPLLEKGHPTFGCFNNLVKVNEDVVALWGRLLRRLPAARLLLVTKQLGEAATRERYRALFAAAGVAGRVELCGVLPHPALLARYNDIDVALDPFPYSGGLTTLESLWMGVPVVTLGGDRFAARHSVSHLTAVGLTECIVGDPDAYLDKAVELAGNARRLAELRMALRPRMAASPLCDGPRFTRGLEAAFRRMWTDWCEKSAQAGEAAVARAAEAYGKSDWPGVEAACRLALQARPQAPDLWTLLGLALRRQGRRDEARDSYRQATAIAPAYADAWHNLGNLLADVGDSAEAIAAYRQACSARPEWLDPLLALTEILRRTGRAAESEALCRDGLLRHAGSAALHLNHGNALRELERKAEAAAAYRRASSLDPGLSLALYNLGVLLKTEDRLAEARAMLEEARSLAGCPAEADILLAELADRLDPAERAVEAYRRALERFPRRPELLHNLGSLHNRLGRPAEAIACYREAIAQGEPQAVMWVNLGNVLMESGDFPAAAAAYEEVLALDPADVATRANLAHLRQKICDWQGVPRLRAEVVEPALAWNGEGMAPVPFPFLSLPTAITQEEQYRIACQYGRSLERAVVPLPAPPGKADGGRLRVGYVSADFHNHATAHLMLGLFRRHDRGCCEIFAYSLGPDDGSEYRRRVIADCDRFVDLRPLPSEAAAKVIRDDAVDILVDLKGYTGGARPALFALRPAPVQVAYLGYPGTMGASFIDYVLTDRVVSPPADQACFSERFVYLPDSYQVNDIEQAIADWRPTRADCGLPETGFVFCCFNSHYKLEPMIFGHWMELLKEVPGSVLWLIGGHAAAEANLRREARARGVAGERLVFAPKLPKDRHLARHHLADLFLDTYYYNAHTTASDALWAGLPVLTCPGGSFASRVSASLLGAVGLPELVMPDFAAYRAEALRLARDPAALAALKEKLAARRLAAPLFDTGRFARAMDDAFARMWAIHAAGEPPRPIPDIEARP